MQELIELSQFEVLGTYLNNLLIGAYNDIFGLFNVILCKMT